MAYVRKASEWELSSLRNGSEHLVNFLHLRSEGFRVVRNECCRSCATVYHAQCFLECDCPHLPWHGRAGRGDKIRDVDTRAFARDDHRTPWSCPTTNEQVRGGE